MRRLRNALLSVFVLGFCDTCVTSVDAASIDAESVDAKLPGMVSVDAASIDAASVDAESADAKLPDILWLEPNSGDCVQILTIETDRENEEGTAHFQSVRQLPRVSLQDKQVEEAINDSYRLMYQEKRNEQIEEFFESWQETAAEDVLCEERVTCTYADDRMISLAVCFADGAENGEQKLHQFSISYNLKNSQRILLSDVLAGGGGAARNIAVLLRGKLQESPVFPELYDPSQAAAYAEQKVGSSEDWYLTADSLVFFFNPEEIAPRSEGVIELAIPYEELGGLVMQDYMEAGEPIDVQNIRLCGLPAIDDSRFPSFEKPVSKLPVAAKN